MPGHVRENAPEAIEGMSHGLGADAHARGAAQLVESIQPRLLAAQKDIGFATGRRAKIDQFIDVVENPARAQHRRMNKAREHNTHGKPVRLRPVEVVSGLSRPGAGHVLDGYGGFSR
ncbi:MAG TPA: hypothetical protein VEG60_07560 [Candidatus Binatia bacterium]|nr:hypothetical protein [Candidatus Binatia bacterium]